MNDKEKIKTILKLLYGEHKELIEAIFEVHDKKRPLVIDAYIYNKLEKIGLTTPAYQGLQLTSLGIEVYRKLKTDLKLYGKIG